VFIKTTDAVFKFVYDDTDYEKLFFKLAASVGATVSADFGFTYPEAIATGYSRLLKLPDHLFVHVHNVCYNQEVFYQRQRSQEEFYTLRFEEFEIPGLLRVQVAGEEINQENAVRAGVFLSSTLFDVSYQSPAGSKVKMINILLDKVWMAKYLGIKADDKILQKYLSLKAASFDAEPLDGEYRRLFNEVMEQRDEDPLRIAIIHNRIMLLVERFFTRLYAKLPSMQFEVRLSKDDIGRVMDIEALLVKDFSQPAPTIAVLARLASMSASKLKKSFKDVYGLPIYEYYQKHRMQRAASLLLSGKYTVKRVGLDLGYTNLSNFAIAFKKEFGLLPSEYIKQNAAQNAGLTTG
jgi:AraC-like DNA-binding protein